MATFLVCQHHLASRIVFGTMFSPEVPATVILAANFIFVSVLLLAALQVGVDGVMIVASVWRRRRTAAPPMVRYAVGFVAMVTAGAGIVRAIEVPVPRQVEVTVQGLPSQYDGYRIVQLTDLHISRLFEADWVESVVRATNALQADLIVITGDLIDGTLEARRRDVEPLKDLSAVDGVWVIPGNHEYYFGYPGWMTRFGELGMHTLANSHVVLGRGGARLTVAGVTDPAAIERGFAGPDLMQALAGAPSGVPVVLLDHQPRLAPLAARSGVALQLSGHTHGGMIVGFNRLIAKLNNGFVSGRYNVAEMTLYVSNGSGLWNGFAVRIGVPAELTVIVLKTDGQKDEQSRAADRSP